MGKEQDRLARLVHEAVAGLPPVPDGLWAAMEARLRRPADSDSEVVSVADAHETLAQATLKLSRATLDALLAGFGGEAPEAAILTLNLASIALSLVIPAVGSDG